MKNTLILIVLFTTSQAVGRTRLHKLIQRSDTTVFFNISGVNAEDFMRESMVYPLNVNKLDLIYNILDDPGKQQGKKINNIILQSPVMVGVQLPECNISELLGGQVKSYSKSFKSYVVADSIPATFYGMGISNDNYKDYLYHVVVNDSFEIVPWSAVARLENQYGVRKPYAYLGKYHFPGRQVLIEVVNKKDYNIREGVIIDWRQLFKPVIEQIYLTRPHKYFNVRHPQKSVPYVSRFDEATHLPVDLHFPANGIQSIIIELGKHEAHPFFIALIRKDKKKSDTSILDRSFITDRLTLNGYRFAQPGMYELIICRSLYDKDFAKYSNYIVRLPFTVYEPRNSRTGAFLQAAAPWFIGGFLIIAVSFVWYYRKNRRKLKQSAYLHQLKQVQLRSLRSQLNPHFVFNALSSIKHLIHKQDIPSAENYLNRFADLTRTVLDTSEEELISLEDELRLLDNYLQMEQLRHPFAYTISVDNTINTVNTEIPAMLLQPLVENAVKHGVSALQGKGIINISIKRHNRALKLMVSDNGKGFVQEVQQDIKKHKGLRLSQERIRLLNETYGSEVVSLDIVSAAGGAVIIITLQDWLT